MAKVGKRRSRIAPVIIPVLWTTALLYTPLAQALGLGRLYVQSHLGQPLRAEIPLLALHSGDHDKIVARIASREDFAQAGIRKSRILRDVQVQVVPSEAGGYEVVLGSATPIDAPFLHFLLKVSWPQGSLLHEYTALLNPTSGVTTLSPGAMPRILPLTAPRPRAARPRAPTTQHITRTRPTKAGQTLWALATRVTPRHATMPQTLEAFLHANPGAFLRHNVNNLRQGVTLKIPTRRQILTIPKRHAAAWLAQEDAAWQHYKTELAQTPTTVRGASKGVAGTISSVPVLPGNGETLKIETTNLKTPSNATPGNGKKGDSTQPLVVRVARLQKELQKTRHLMTIENQELALLEKQARVKNAKIPPTVSGTIHPNTPLVHTSPPKTPGPAHALVVKRPLAKPVVLAPVPPAPSFFATLMASARLPILGALLAIVLGGGALIIRRRRQTIAEFEESILSGGGLNSEGLMPDTAGLKSPDVSFVSGYSETNGAGAVHTDDVDPIAEADVYLAYGRDEQAEEILKEAAIKDPARIELKLKLLDIYFQRHDAKTFEIVAEEIYAASSGSGPAWKKVEEMGRKLDPANPLFKGGSARRGDDDQPLSPSPANRIDFAAVARELNEVSIPGPRTTNPEADEDILIPEFKATDQEPQDDGLEWVTNSTPTPSSAPDLKPTAFGGADDDQGLDFSLDIGRPSELVDDSEPPMRSHASALDSQAESLNFEWHPEAAVEATIAPSGPKEEKQDEKDDEFAIQFDDEDMSNLTAADLQLSDVTSTDASKMGSLFPFPSDEATAEGEGEVILEEEPQSASHDTVETKIDLARAYIEMGETEGARDILDEVRTEGNQTQRALAESLIAGIA